MLSKMVTTSKENFSLGQENKGFRKHSECTILALLNKAKEHRCSKSVTSRKNFEACIYPRYSEDLPSQLHKCVLNCAWWWIPMLGSFISERKWIYLCDHPWRREHHLLPLFYLLIILYATNTIFFTNFLLRCHTMLEIGQEKKYTLKKKDSI